MLCGDARYTQGLGIDEPLEVYEGKASYYYHADGLGSIVALTKSNGSAVNTYFGYNTFGGMPAASETVSNPYRFTARDWDSETSLYYYRARYYDPLFGRFVSEDPIDLAGGPNFYVYVGNEPTVFVDPSGLRGKKPKAPEPKTPSDAIYVLCCKNGTFGVCPGPAGPAGNDWVGDCEREHERQHVIDFKNGTVVSLTNCGDPKNEGRAIEVDQKNKELAECSAYQTELRCLKAADQQLESIKERKSFILQQIEKYCPVCGKAM